ncbi:hypothetical protein CYMTET_12501 [Cymbomonas tetramitiformis]|uniref:Uncharacterized protein n=1 Tax=Cymbomonas tetramitiformis TaxID=36881 RepID=A0AAE0GKC8_9CHLO|nr:hypothetical protein CYMTET_12501 [Cymbomonas tetramitiformis]
MQPAIHLGTRGSFGQPTEKEVGAQTDISIVDRRDRQHPLFVPCGCFGVLKSLLPLGMTAAGTECLRIDTRELVGIALLVEKAGAAGEPVFAAAGEWPVPGSWSCGGKMEATTRLRTLRGWARKMLDGPSPAPSGLSGTSGPSGHLTREAVQDMLNSTVTAAVVSALAQVASAGGGPGERPGGRRGRAGAICKWGGSGARGGIQGCPLGIAGQARRVDPRSVIRVFQQAGGRSKGSGPYPDVLDDSFFRKRPRSPSPDPGPRMAPGGAAALLAGAQAGVPQLTAERRAALASHAAGLRTLSQDLLAQALRTEEVPEGIGSPPAPDVQHKLFMYFHTWFVAKVAIFGGKKQRWDQYNQQPLGGRRNDAQEVSTGASNAQQPPSTGAKGKGKGGGRGRGKGGRHQAFPAIRDACHWYNLGNCTYRLALGEAAPRGMPASSEAEPDRAGSARGADGGDDELPEEDLPEVEGELPWLDLRDEEGLGGGSQGDEMEIDDCWWRGLVPTSFLPCFDESVATHVAKKILGGKSERFAGNEHNADVLFFKLVPAIKEAFISEDLQFESLFDLSDATVTVRAEANRLLFSTMELIIYRTQTLLSVRVKANEDPQDTIAIFNSALASARRKNTLDDDEVKGLFINALDPAYYAPVVNKTAFPAASASAVDKHVYALTTEEAVDCSALSDLASIVLDLKKQVIALANKINGHGYTPRSNKPGRPGQKIHRLAVDDLPTGGSWPQGLSKKIAFDKSRAEFVPVCRHSVCLKASAKHWHRDCPHGGPRAEKGDSVSMNAFATADYELDYLATSFRNALDTGDNDKFNALCVLAGGRPELIDEISSAAFETEDISAKEHFLWGLTGPGPTEVLKNGPWPMVGRNDIIGWADSRDSEFVD